MRQGDQYTLPEVLELSGMMGETEGRTILLHVRTLTCAEIVEPRDIHLAPGTPHRIIGHVDAFGITERVIMAVHFAHGMPCDSVAECAEALDILEGYYLRYTAWEDDNIAADDIASQN